MWQMVKGLLLKEKSIPKVIYPQKRKLLKKGERAERDRINHPLLLPCNCKQQCYNTVDNDKRKVIHSKFWERDYDERMQYIHSRMHRDAINPIMGGGVRQICSTVVFFNYS